jgi:enoyl-CoA hydratase/carnithine racemase
MPVHYEKRDGVAVFLIDNGKLNVMRPEFYETWYRDVCDFLEDDTLKVGVLMGAGGRPFCAGDDIKSPDRTSDLNPNWPAMLMSMRRKKPLIGAVRGWCLGQGFINLMTLTDIRIAAPDAKFGIPEIKYGMGGASGATQLGRQIPRSLAMYLALTGDYFSAEQALDSHLITHIIPDHELEDFAFRIADKIAQHPIGSIHTEMEAFWLGEDLSRADAFGALRELYRKQRQSHEASAGGRAPTEFQPLTQAD